jgi:hypothetical protein
MRNSTTYSTYIRRRIAVATIATIALVSVAQLTSKVIDSKYAYSCPTMTVIVDYGDTLSGITEKYCSGHTLQASWDIAEDRGTSAIGLGDIIQLGGK